MQNYYLFRFKVIESQQRPLFGSSLPRSEFIRTLINKKPSKEIRNGYEWHLGNIEAIGGERLRFAIGRITKASKEKYDEKTGNFSEVNDEVAPFTYALLDIEMSLIAIALKTKLSPTAKGIAHSLEKLLNSQSEVQENEVRIELAEITDPDTFIQQMEDAYSVIGFTVEFSGPNPFDVDKDFHQPMEKYLAATAGEKGVTTIRGENLDKGSLEKMARSVASTGNQAKARIKKNKDSKAITKQMKGNPIVVQVEDVNDDIKAKGLLIKLREAYERIRKRNKDD